MTRLTRRLLLTGSLGASIAPAWAARVMTVHKTPGCGCCEEWARHMQGAGFTVSVRPTQDLDRIRREAGVPDALASCHTGFIGSLVIEGHVPAAAIDRLLAAPGSWLGLAVPGMPLGSPGMEVPGQPPEVYEIWGLRSGAPPERFALARGSALLPG